MALFVMLRVAFLLCCELTFIVILRAKFYCYAEGHIFIVMTRDTFYCYAEGHIFIVMLSHIFWYAECRYDECPYAKCRGAVKNHATPAKLYLAPSPTRSQAVLTHLW
jgi:hypothetical protein